MNVEITPEQAGIIAAALRVAAGNYASAAIATTTHRPDRGPAPVFTRKARVASELADDFGRIAQGGAK